MNHLPDGRIPAEKLLRIENGVKHEYPLTYIGSGTSAMVYRMTEANGSDVIVKEFYPLIRRRTDAENPTPVLPSERRTPELLAYAAKNHLALCFADELEGRDRAAYEARMAAFLAVDEAVITIYREHMQADSNMLVVPKPDTSENMGEILVCGELKGTTLRALVELKPTRDETLGKRHFLYDVLTLTYRLLFDVSMWHESGYLNMDIKPENLFCVSIDGEPGPIRALDFGSSKAVENVKKFIRDYLEKNRDPDYFDEREAIQEIDRISFSTSRLYYSPQVRADAIRGYLWALEWEKDNFGWAFFRMDLLAVIKTCLFCLNQWNDNLDGLEKMTDDKIVEELLRRFFRTSVTDTLLGDYYLYWLLRELGLTVMNLNPPSDVAPRQMARYLRDKVGDMLCLLSEDKDLLKRGLKDEARVEKRKTVRALYQSFCRNEPVLKGFSYAWVDKTVLCTVEEAEESSCKKIKSFDDLIELMENMCSLERHHLQQKQTYAPLEPGELLRRYLLMDPVKRIKYKT